MKQRSKELSQNIPWEITSAASLAFSLCGLALFLVLEGPDISKASSLVKPLQTLNMATCWLIKSGFDLQLTLTCFEEANPKYEPARCLWEPETKMKWSLYPPDNQLQTAPQSGSSSIIIPYYRKGNNWRTVARLHPLSELMAKVTFEPETFQSTAHSVLHQLWVFLIHFSPPML